MRCTGAALAAALTTAVTAIVAAQAFDLRPGEWEYTVTLKGSAADVPPSVPPAMRDKIVAAWAKPHVVRDCLTAKEIADGQLAKDDDDSECKVAKRNVTTTTFDLTRTCTGDEARTETIHVQTDGRERMHLEATRQAGSGPAKITMDAKWIAATCKD